MNSSMKSWMVYYIDSDGFREGVEVIAAQTRNGAETEYRTAFNIGPELKVRAVLRYLGRPNG